MDRKRYRYTLGMFQLWMVEAEEDDSDDRVEVPNLPLVLVRSARHFFFFTVGIILCLRRSVETSRILGKSA